MKYEIHYRCPRTNALLSVVEDFEDSGCKGSGNFITAESWAEDMGYTLSDKGWYTVEEVQG